MRIEYRKRKIPNAITNTSTPSLIKASVELAKIISVVDDIIVSGSVAWI